MTPMTALTGRRRFLAMMAVVVCAAALWTTFSSFLVDTTGAPEAPADARPAVESSQSPEFADGTETGATRSVLDSARVLYWRFVRRLEGNLLQPAVALWIVLFLLVEQLFPAQPIRRLLSSDKLMDAAYPLFTGVLRVTILIIAYGPIRNFFAQYLPFMSLGLLDGLPLLLQGFLAFLVMDFSFWLSHYLRHKVPWLWYFHAIHHSARELSPMTVWRAHPLEEPLTFLITMIPVGIFGGDQSAWVVVTVFYGAAWPFFIHSNIRTNLGPLRYLIVSPQFHRVHHSIRPEQFDKNFGEHIVLWDWLFGTIELDTESYPETGIRDDAFVEVRTKSPVAMFGTWVRHGLYPFVMIGRSVSRRIGAGRNSAGRELDA